MQTIGIIDIVWNGKQIPVEKGVKFKSGGLAQKAFSYGRGKGYTTEYKHGEVKITTFLPKGGKLSDIKFEGEFELQVKTDIGLTYVFNDASIEDLVELDDNGKIMITWSVGSGEEIG